MSSGTPPDTILKLRESPDDVELDAIPDLLDQIERDLKVIDLGTTYITINRTQSSLEWTTLYLVLGRCFAEDGLYTYYLPSRGAPRTISFSGRTK